MRSLNAGSASRAYVARGVSPPARHSMNRPRSLTASVAASTMRWAAVSASAAGSAHTVRLTSDAMLKSYPLVEAALAPECLESEQRRPTARRLGLRRPHDGASEGVGNDLGPGAGAAEGAAGGDDRMVCGRAGGHEAVDHREPERHGLEYGAHDLDSARVQPKAADQTAPPATPSRRSLATQMGKNREAVSVRRQRGERRFDFIVAPEAQHLAAPRVDVAPFRRRSS